MKNLISSTQIIARRDTMSIEELRAINSECRKKFGYLGYREIFITMGYEPAYNGLYYDIMK